MYTILLMYNHKYFIWKMINLNTKLNGELFQMLMKMKLTVVQLHIIMWNTQIIIFRKVYSWQKIMNIGT